MNINQVPKKIFFWTSLSCVLIGLNLLFFNVTHAQEKTSVSQRDPNAQSVIEINQDQQVYTSSVLTTKDNYVAGDKIDYSFQLYNATPFDVNSLYYKVIISDAKRGERSYSYVVKGPISIKAGETIKIVDSTNAPRSLLGDEVVLRIVPVIQSAITYPFAQSKPFMISGALPAYEMGSWAVITNDGQYYPFQAGPSLYQNATPSEASIDVWLRPQTEVGTVKYHIKVYKKTVGIGEPVFSVTSDTYSVNPALDTEDEGGLDLSIPLPTFSYTPGVYEAYIEFVDQENIIRAPIIVARYVVQGDIATIQFARTDKDQVKKGESIKLVSSITGSPTDIFTQNKNQSGTSAHMKAEILNETGATVGLVEKDIKLTEDFFDQSDFVAHADAQAMYVHMTISKGDKVLAEWSSPISSDYFDAQTKAQTKHMKNIIIITVSVFLVICIVVIHLFLKRRNTGSVVTYLLVLGAFGVASLIPLSAHASSAPSVQVTFPAQNQVLLPGQKFTPKASVYYKACANWGYNVNAQFFHNGAALDTLHSIAQVNTSPAHCTGGLRKGKSCLDVGKNSSNCPKSDGSRARCSFDTHEFTGPNGEDYMSQTEATAPMTPGVYVVKAVVQGTGFTSELEGISALQGSDENTYIVGAGLATPTVSSHTSSNCTPGITLNWSAISGANRYSIMRSNNQNDGFVVVTSTANTEYTDAAITTGQTYFYKIIAQSTTNGSESAPSTVISATWIRPETCPACTSTTPGCGGDGDNTCGRGTKYCAVTSSCIPEANSCENPCASPLIQAGRSLSTTGLCKAGYTLSSSSLFGSTNTNSWYWTCQTPGTAQTIQCSKSCPTGTFFDQTNNACSADISDWCPNIPGDQRDVSLYTRDQMGNCLASGKIKYFKFEPDIADISCPAFWDTEVSPGAYAECKINGVAVADKYQTGSPAIKTYPVGGQYVLSCAIKLREDDSFVKNVESKARCFKNAKVKEN